MRARAPRLVVACSVLVGCLTACAGRDPGSGSDSVAPARPSVPAAFPEDRAERNAALRKIGVELHAALIAGDPTRVLVDEGALVDILDPTGATRAAALRVGVGARLSQAPSAYAPLHGSRFLGACVQGSRSEAAGRALHLAAEGWVFNRILVVAERSDGRRVASWIEGPFVYTNAGFTAIDLVRVEAPRIDHSDLEFITCDVEVGTVHHNM